MENILILLSRRRERAFRRDLIAFFEALSLYLRAGYDLSFSWPEILDQTRGLAGEFVSCLRGKEGADGIGPLLSRLTESYPVESHRVWFAVLRELYEQGAPLTEAVQAIGASLREEQSRDWEAFARTLPTKANLILLVAFLPPTLILLFLPLLMTFEAL